MTKTKKEKTAEKCSKLHKDILEVILKATMGKFTRSPMEMRDHVYSSVEVRFRKMFKLMYPVAPTPEQIFELEALISAYELQENLKTLTENGLGYLKGLKQAHAILTKTVKQRETKISKK